jgi:hypothetical protein
MLISGLTIANVMYRRIVERKREIYTLNAIGLNPANITFIFLGESLVIGVISGVIGYIMGVSSYTFFLGFNIPLLIVPKVEVGWAVMAILLSVFTTIISSVIPSYSSAKTVSSMYSRKWSKDKKIGPVTAEGSYSFLIPVRIHQTIVEEFLEFMVNIFRPDEAERMTFQERNSKKLENESIDTYKTSILYDLRVSKKGHSRGFPMECEIFLTQTGTYFFEPHVTCCFPARFGQPPRGYEALVEQVISHIRRKVLYWDATTQKLISH